MTSDGEGHEAENCGWPLEYGEWLHLIAGRGEVRACSHKIPEDKFCQLECAEQGSSVSRASDENAARQTL